MIDNFPESQVDAVDAVNNPEDESAGKREVPFSKVLYIEQDDFREDPPKQYYRLSPGREVRLRYGYFITAKTVVKNDRGEDPNQVDEGQEFTTNLNPNSLEVIAQAKLEPSLANAPIEGRYQFERLGYFCVDPDSKPGRPVFNRTVALKDTWAKVEKKNEKKSGS